jgi:hypothetical protein
MLVEPDRSPAPAAVVAAPGLPTGWLALLWFGMQQPLIGLRVVVREPALRRIAAVPVLFLVGLCLLVATSERAWVAGIELFFATMLSLAAVPVVLFGGTYRRLAAAARGPLGLAPRGAARPSLGSAIANAISQMILVAIGLVPVYLFVEFMAEWAGVGGLFVGLAWLLGALWTLHWIAIEALDNAQTLAPAADQPRPFARLFEAEGDLEVRGGPAWPRGRLGQVPGADVDLEARVEQLRRVELGVAGLAERDEVGLAAVRRQLDVALALGADRRLIGQRAPAGHVVVADEHPRRVGQRCTAAR